jgi:hypothetical protein
MKCITELNVGVVHIILLALFIDTHEIDYWPGSQLVLVRTQEDSSVGCWYAARICPHDKQGEKPAYSPFGAPWI